MITQILSTDYWDVLRLSGHPAEISELVRLDPLEAIEPSPEEKHIHQIHHTGRSLRWF